MKPASPILGAVHEGARDLHEAGAIDKRRMIDFDALCRVPLREFTGGKIRALRRRLKLSQAGLASILNTSLATVRQWENGATRPRGPSLRLLDLLERKGVEALI